MLPTPEPPDFLVQACAEGSCVLYAGAGLSAPSGFPTWGPLVTDLINWADQHSLVDPSFVEALRASVQIGDLDSAADGIVAALREAGHGEAFERHLRSIFIPPVQASNEYHRLLRRIRFSAVLTTNFDRSLEEAYQDTGTPVYTPADTEPLLEHLSGRGFFILKLYGTLDRPDTLLVAPAQYAEAIVGNMAFAQFMESLFVSRTILFLGASLEGIQGYLEGVKFRRSNRRHCALVSVSGQAWKTKADLLRRRYGIEVIAYPVSADHPEIPAFLRLLAERVRARLGLRTDEEHTVPGQVWHRPSRLRHVRLFNVGPFDEFSIDLTRNWNILLGNNGVGKSTILKAIAVGLCGRDAQPYAGRILKRGASTGQIVLETTDGTEYITEIAHTSGAAEISVRPAQPLQAEGWLALGFPPLRTVSWQRPRGPVLDEGRARPDPSDLLPLVSGAPDPRLDQLKQWIVTLDYRIKDERSRGGTGLRHAQLLDDFFHIIGQLTSELKIEYKEVSPETHEVLVVTDDGDVPIEAVSQGTSSLLGWVGVFMQRLYTVFDQKERPTEQHAIILIDEIDAHMHPDWQQSLVPLLSKTFPNVQFIATTHSPLVVAGMPAEQIVRLDRDEDGRIVRLDIPPDMTMGRADQVLTGPLFGLTTTVDPITQQRIEDYQRLLGKRDRTREEEAEFRRLEQVLEFRVPLPIEQPAERRAQELVEALLEAEISEFPRAREALLQKAAELIREAGFARGRAQ